MTSFLVLLPAFEPIIKYVAQCANIDLQWVTLVTFLTTNNFQLCTRDEYENPDLLKPNVNYCVISKNLDPSSYLVFQCLPTPDWPKESEEPAPNYTSVIGNLQFFVAEVQPVVPVVPVV